MQLKRLSSHGTTARRKAFWDICLDAVKASQKVGGKNIQVREMQNDGSIISIGSSNPGRSGTPVGTPTGACCSTDGFGTCSILTAAACAASHGAYQGNNSTCSPNPCECSALGYYVISPVEGGGPV